VQDKRVNNVVLFQKVSHSPNIFSLPCLQLCKSLNASCPTMLTDIYSNSNNSVRWQ